MNINDRQTKMEIAQKCIDSGKSPLYFNNTSNDSQIINYRFDAGENEIQSGDRVAILGQMKHLDSGRETNGMVIPSVVACYYHNGAMIIESNSAFITNVDIEREYKELDAQRKEIRKNNDQMKDLVSEEQTTTFYSALVERCNERGLTPIFIDNIQNLYGNHNSTENAPHKISIEEIEPGMRIYCKCDAYNMETGELVGENHDMCIPMVVDTCMMNGDVFIEASNGNFISTHNFQEQLLDLNRDAKETVIDNEIDAPTIGE